MRILRLASVSIILLGLHCGPAAARDLLDRIVDFAGSGTHQPAARSGGHPAFQVGLMLPRGGAFSGPAERMENGWRIAVQLSNGTVAGRPVKIVDGDTGNDPKVAVKAAIGMLRDRPVDVFAGIISTDVARAMMLLADKVDKPVIIAGAVSDELLSGRCNPRAARTSFSIAPYLAAAGRFLARNYRTAATLAPNTAGSERMIARFSKAFRAGGGHIVQRIWAPPGQKYDWRNWLTRAAQTGPRLIYTTFGSRNAERLVDGYDTARLKSRVAVVAPEWFYNPRTLNWRGDQAAGMRFLTSHYPRDPTPANRIFVSAYRAAYDDNPDSYAYLGYENAMAVLLTAAELKDRHVDAATFVSTMKGLDYTGLMPRGRFAFNRANSAMLTSLHWVEIRHKDGRTWLKELAKVPVKPDNNSCTTEQAKR